MLRQVEELLPLLLSLLLESQSGLQQMPFPEEGDIEGRPLDQGDQLGRKGCSCSWELCEERIERERERERALQSKMSASGSPSRCLPWMAVGVEVEPVFGAERLWEERGEGVCEWMCLPGP